MPVEEVYPEGLHRSRSVAAERAGFDEIVLTDVLVLEMCAHGYLSLETSIADRTMVGQCFGVCGKVLRQVVLAEESLLTDAAFVGLNAGVSHLVPTHVGAIGKLHIAHIAFEEFPVAIVVIIVVVWV